ncbi:MFS transporter [Nitratireductor aquimarinus]|uniref:MFS transporter n=1 Tax=Nitratireductor TaxID=245876 RepID=UPI0019D348FA|nr:MULTISPECIES: MFS transporter [Nitratireductor]MBN7777347.1 MFS transporter [Nitratireductor pacificus]MBN7781018.1 MFS transporter [Nitratireductor pacificus]MBN7789824.1 MFS transporter [Nitratireductor aquimarinus]MBY6099556.1 MFS transporter [Nitratireductor aquimarinus]MCA1261595.1 MFS transporter [Nitratireductor aquimarinus]
MLGILRNQTYSRLFTAQVIALLGTGLMTVALGLLAYELAGADAGAVLGTALAIKMIAYVGVAPVAQALSDNLPRRALLVSLDVFRAAVALSLPFITEVWQIYVLIFLLQVASASFTPTFQAVIPDILPDEEEYTRALSLSRLAYDLENLISPMLAAALLTVISFHYLFAGTMAGFLVSAGLILSITLPAAKAKTRRSFAERTTRGMRIYLATPRLRGLLAISLAVAAAGAMVIVNTVVIVQARFGLSEVEVAWAFAAFGSGSMVAALALPQLLDRVADRPVMIAGAVILTVGTALGAAVKNYAALLPLWLVIGIGYSAAQTPSGRLLRRSAQPEDRPAIFAAQFALSHACWLVSYPLAGQLGARIGLEATFLVMAAIAAVAIVLAVKFWPAEEAADIPHEHPELAPDHPHLREHRTGGKHRHAYVIDDLHPRWPSAA